MSPNHFPAVRRKLLRWYARHQRDLPWRRTADPYAIWIAETMLQQTQVTTVVPYYERFLKRFPTLAALARAPLSQVLTLWSGLGYYRRAENLKKTARELLLKHHGRLPDDYDKLMSLPGIGDYTAGALMSIAFGRPYPALDGNVRRVLGRVFNFPDEAELREIAKRLVPKSEPGYFNQALMELGARVCLPKMARCELCPLAVHCHAARSSALAQPRAGQAKALRNVTWPLAIVRRGGKLLLRRRSRGGMLSGLWEFPGGVVPEGESVQAALKQQLGGMKGAWGRRRRIGALRHAITDKRIHAPIYLIDLTATTEIRLANSGWRWIAPSSLRRYPLSAMTLKAARVLASHEKNSL